MKKILILGATGYLGKYLSNAFLNEGYKLVIVCRKSSDISSFSGRDNIEILYVEDTEISKKIQGLTVDIFINAAVEYGRDNNFFGVFETNLHLPLLIINSLKNIEQVLCISFDSFSSKSEFAEFRTLPFYVISKLQLNEWLQNLNISRKLSVVILRLEHLIGKNENETKFNGWIINQCKTNNGTINLTEGRQIRDFIFVEDVVSAVFIVLKNEKIFKNKFNLYDLGTGIGHTVRHFVEMIHLMTNSKAKLNFGAISYSEKEIMKSVADARLLKGLGWKPMEDLNQILEKVV